MNNLKQFINWRLEPDKRGLPTKVPISAGGVKIDAHDSRHWKTKDEAAATGRPLAFVFSKNDPYFFLDIDHAWTLKNGWSLLSVEILSRFPGCAVEVSQSGKGLHIFGVGRPGPEVGCKAGTYGLELYFSGRFVALTGTHATGSADTNGQAGLDWLTERFFKNKPSVQSAGWTSEPSGDWSGPDDDAELLKRARRSRSASGAFGNSATFSELFDADVNALSKHYPGAGPDGFDRSSADAALCSHLSFYTGRNCERIERIFSLSALADRAKWRDREDYRKRTILNAVSICRTVYNRPAKTKTSTPGTYKTGAQFMDIEAQREFFKGCAYVASKHRVFSPNYGLLKADQFKALYGGYQFAIAPEGRPSKNAFEALTESQLYTFPKVFGTCFRPELPPGEIPDEEGRKYINTYTPANTEKTPGDVSPFLDLLSRILPSIDDRSILLAYMAACVQHVGIKFQWCPLIQGAEGNGKTFLATAISKAVGERYSHFPNANDLQGNGLKFTGWLYEKLFIGIEDLFPDGKTDLQEGLKDFITNARKEMQPKGYNQTMEDNRANFMMFTNHKDAVRKTPSDRRYCIFYTAQQRPGDLKRSGMSGAYFPRLYEWARAGGYAKISHYLSVYDIPKKLNPATECHRAPVTSSTAEAYRVSLGPAEQEIMEAIGEGRHGFRGGWVSSVALDTLLSEKRRRVPQNKRRALMEALGYVWKERANNPSMQDGGRRPTLYCLPAIAEAVPVGAEAIAHYVAAQEGATPN